MMRSSRPRWRTGALVLGLLLIAACTDATASSSKETVASTTLPPTTTTTIPAIDLPLPAGANTVYILGDSVILGTQYVINQQLAGWQVTLDAKVSRRMDQGLDVVASKGGNLGRVVVVHLCTNWYGGDYGAVADTLISMLRGADRIVWSTCVPWVGQINQANDAIKELPSRHPNLAVVDWAAIAGTPGYTAGDGLHLQGQGQYALADLLATAIGPAPPPA
jgi:hypothetical protein